MALKKAMAKPRAAKAKASKAKAVKAPKAPARKAAAAKPAASRSRTLQRKLKRYKCNLCGYIYSPLIGEPHNGIPAGTAFEDLPETYKCPVCGMQGKGKVGKWGFSEWEPEKFVCRYCGYVYDPARGEPQHGIKPGTRFEDLPDDYVCPVCAIDTKINRELGKVGKASFDPIMV